MTWGGVRNPLEALRREKEEETLKGLFEYIM